MLCRSCLPFLLFLEGNIAVIQSARQSLSQTYRVIYLVKGIRGHSNCLPGDIKLFVLYHGRLTVLPLPERNVAVTQLVRQTDRQAGGEKT